MNHVRKELRRKEGKKGKKETRSKGGGEGEEK